MAAEDGEHGTTMSCPWKCWAAIVIPDNHGRLGWDRFLLADSFELCSSLPVSLLIISFCFFPMTDESARGEKNQRDKFCSVGAAEPHWLTLAYSRFTLQGLN